MAVEEREELAREVRRVPTRTRPIGGTSTRSSVGVKEQPMSDDEPMDQVIQMRTKIPARLHLDQRLLDRALPPAITFDSGRSAFLRQLFGRGLNGVHLIISDACRGFKERAVDSGNPGMTRIS
jgi:hypothetical protein